MDRLATKSEGEQTIRRAMVRDADAMALVLERAVARRDGQIVNKTLQDIKSVDELHERMLRPHAWTYVATVGSKLAGFALGYPSTEADNVPSEDGADYLSRLMVDPDFWGTGIGSALLGHAGDMARSSGKRTMSLWTAASNQRARQLYEQHGYRLSDLERMSQHQGRLVHYVLDLTVRQT